MAALLARLAPLPSRAIASLCQPGKRKTSPSLVSEPRPQASGQLRQSHRGYAVRAVPGRDRPVGRANSGTLSAASRWNGFSKATSTVPAVSGEDGALIPGYSPEEAGAFARWSSQEWEEEEILERPEDQPLSESQSVPEGVRIASVPLSNWQARKTVHQQALGSSFKHAIEQSLLRREPERLIKAFVAASDDVEYMRSIPDATFTEILSLLQPNNLIRHLTTTHVEISPIMTEQMQIMPIKEVVNDYLHIILDILAKRREAGRALNVADYALLLNVARSTGSRSVVKAFWSTMKSDGVVPNTACYNHYLATIVWNDSHGHARNTIRITDFFTLARSKRKLGRGFGGYRFGDGGIKSLTTDLFNEMHKSDIVANEETFCTFITGLSREADTDGFKNILYRVWDINVGKIMSGRIEGPDQNVKMSTTSPLYPSSRLLFTIAHAFGTNNDIPSALRIVDYVSRQYSVPITDDVWAQLFNWTFLLALPRVSTGFKTGQLPRHSVQSLWDTMTSPAYNVKPTMIMFNKLIKNLWTLRRPHDMLMRMNEASALYLDSRTRARTAFHDIDDAINGRNRGRPTSQPIEALQREAERLNLVRRRNRFWMKRWLRLLLSASHYWRNEHDRWSTNCVPDILGGMWFVYAPRRVSYETPGGRVTIILRRPREMVRHQRLKARGREEQNRLLRANARYPGSSWATPTRTNTRRMQDTAGKVKAAVEKVAERRAKLRERRVVQHAREDS